MPMVFPRKAEAGEATGAGGGAGPAGFPKIPVLPMEPRKRPDVEAAPQNGKSEPTGASRADGEAKAATVEVVSSKDAPAKPSSSSDAPRKPAAAPGIDAQPALQKLLTEVRRDLEQTVNREMKRVEQEFGSIVQALSMQLIESRERADKFERESSALRDANESMEKKVRVLRELQEKLKDV